MNLPGLRLDDPAALPWRETRVPGVAWLPLHLDQEERGDEERAGSGERSRGGATVLIRMEPGCGYMPHRHVGSEDVLVLAGGYRDELGTYRAGDHVHYPPGSVHAPVALGERGGSDEQPACVLFAVAPAGIELLPG